MHPCWISKSALLRLRIIAFILVALSAGCDDFNATTLAESPEEVGPRIEVATDAMNRPEGAMASIGPESAQRIYYQFIDDKGRVQFVERLTDVPEAWREQVGYVEMSHAPPLTPEAARKTWQISSERATQIMLAARTADSVMGAAHASQVDVILYSATWCGYCTKARAHLDEAGVRYELRDVDNAAIGRELREKTGRGGVPVLDFSGEILRGYSADQYDRAIRTIKS